MGDLIAGPWPQKRNKTGDPPPQEPTMETRVAVLEKTVEHIEKDLSEIKGDIRILLGALIAGFLLLSGLMAHGFKWF